MQENNLHFKKQIELMENEQNVKAQERASKAYEAVLNPQEGTILTVIRKSAEAASMAAKNGSSFIEMLDTSYDAAQGTLEKTPELLPVLKKAGVVDAGGQGFVYIMEGWIKAYKNEDIDDVGAFFQRRG